MSIARFPRRWTAALLVMLAFTLGCGNSEGRLKVTGSVKHPDGTVPKSQASAYVEFTPEDAASLMAKGATAPIDRETGEFELYTQKPGDGAAPGSYKVTFRINSVYPPRPDGSSSVIPLDYTKAETTPLSAVVDPEHVRFDLTVPKRGQAGKKK